MANKIYTMLVDIITELKEARDGKKTLSEVLSDFKKSKAEVDAAKGEYVNLGDKLQKISDNLSVNAIEIIGMKSVLDSADLDAKAPVNNIVEVLDKEIIISIDDKISYTEDLITLPPATEKFISNKNDSSYEVLIKSDSPALISKSIRYNNEADVIFDATSNVLINSSLQPKPLDDSYKIPLAISQPFYSEANDTCLISNIGECVSNYGDPDSNNRMTLKNHMVNALRGTRPWIINRSQVTMLFSFKKNVALTKVVSSISTNSSHNTTLIETSTDGTSWSAIYAGTEDNLVLPLESQERIKHLRFSFNSFEDPSINNIIEVNKIEIYTTSHITESRDVYASDMVRVYDDLRTMSVKPLNNDDAFIKSKHLIINKVDQSSTYTYIPQTHSILPHDFHDSRGIAYTDNTLKKYQNKIADTTLINKR